MGNAIVKPKNEREFLQEKIEALTPEQQQEVVKFIDFLLFKSQKPEQTEPVSFSESAKEFIGCVDGGPGDLATNKKYLRELGK